MADALFLELEGVIAETRPHRAAALAEALAAEGVAVLAEVAEELAGGRPVHRAVEGALRASGRTLDDVATDLAVLRAERAFESRMGRGVTLVPGALPFINRAHGRTRLAVVTRVPRAVTDLVLGLAGVEFAFEAIVTAEDVPAHAPPGSGFRLAMERMGRRRPLGTTRRAALVDGADAAAHARAAGLRSIVVGEIPTHEALEADGMVPSLDGLTIDMLDALLVRAEEGVS